MPGKRNLARERDAHGKTYAARLAAIHHQLVTQLPELDRALIGWPAILAQLHRCGLRRLDGRPISVRMVRRWRLAACCPVLAGSHTIGRCYTPPLSTSYALTAWTLSQRTTDERAMGFRVALAPAPAPDGKAPEQSDKACRKPRRASAVLASGTAPLHPPLRRAEPRS